MATFVILVAAPLLFRSLLVLRLISFRNFKIYVDIFVLVGHTSSQEYIYCISSNRTWVSNTSRVSNRSRGSKGEYHRANCTSTGISLCSNKSKTKNPGVLNTCSSVNRVVLIEAGSLIEARDLTLLEVIWYLQLSMNLDVITISRHVFC